MTILRFNHKAGKTIPKAKLFRKLLNQLGQQSQLAASKYVDSTRAKAATAWVCLLTFHPIERLFSVQFPALVRRLVCV
jgi:hypothetical protein